MATERKKAFFTRKEVAARWGVSQKYLDKLATTGGGPAFTKFGRMCRYSVKDLKAFEASRRRKSTSEINGDATAL